MTVKFGFSPLERQPRNTPLNAWMDEIDETMRQLGSAFQSVWMTDHLFWGDYYAYECWTVLTWIAARWPNLYVGPMVIGQNYRNPALLAKMAATLQVFSAGRLIMGVGAGWKEDEYRAYGYEFPPVADRIEQMEETFEILKLLWTQPGKVTYRGRHYTLNDAILEPKPDPVPPLLFGGGGDKTMKIAARHCDWWNLPDASLERFRERAAVMRRNCESIGRDPATLRKTWFGRLVIARTPAEVEALAKSRPGYHYSPQNAIIGTPSQVVEQMSALVEAGVSYFMLDILGLPNRDITGMIAEEVVPRISNLTSG